MHDGDSPKNNVKSNITQVPVVSLTDLLFNLVSGKSKLFILNSLVNEYL